MFQGLSPCPRSSTLFRRFRRRRGLFGVALLCGEGIQDNYFTSFCPFVDVSSCGWIFIGDASCSLSPHSWRFSTASSFSTSLPLLGCGVCFRRLLLHDASLGFHLPSAPLRLPPCHGNVSAPFGVGGAALRRRLHDLIGGSSSFPPFSS